MASRLAPKITVYLDGKPQPQLRVLSCQRAAGSVHHDHATLFLDDGKLAANFYIGKNNGAEVEIVAVPTIGADKILHWGTLSVTDLSIAEKGDKLHYISRIEPYHFGEPVSGQIHHDPLRGGNYVLQIPLTFNPTIDGITRGNRHTTARFRKNGRAWPVFVDPLSVSSAAGRQLQGTAGAEWKLSEVLEYLFSFNDQKFIRNQQGAQFVVSDATDVVRNLTLPAGLYLSECLDRVLEPFGYGWFVDLQRRGVRFITIFKRGVGSGKTNLLLQAPGETVDNKKSNTALFDVQFDSSAAVNEIEAVGAAHEIEAAWELERGWSTDNDALVNTPELLDEQHPDFAAVKDVWRKWVLNEAGDYFGLRPEFARPFSFTNPPVATAQLPIRRKFLPTLTIDKTGEPAGKISGCEVEYYDNTSGQQGWKPVASGVSILDDECGIYFNGQKPPDEIYRFGSNARVRITATIRLDSRVRWEALKDADSPNLHRHKVTLDLSKRFFYRRIDRGNAPSCFVAQIAAGTLNTRERDDTKAIKEYAIFVQDAFDRATLEGPIVIEGIDNLYQLGQSVVGIIGRNISLAAHAKGKLYPQIVGVTFDVQRQTTTLQLDQYLTARRFLTDSQGIE